MRGARADIRLDASPQAAGDGLDPSLGHPRTCLWCGGAYVSPVAESEFCATPCRKSFNNLRAMRGAELYDLFMALRHDRAVATAFKAWRLLNRLASGFRAEDRAQRAGRRSWRHPAEIIARRPYLVSETLTLPRAGRGRP